MIPFLLFRLTSGAAAAIGPADGEILYVLADDRTIAVETDDRTMAVAADDRTIVIEARPTP